MNSNVNKCNLFERDFWHSSTFLSGRSRRRVSRPRSRPRPITPSAEFESPATRNARRCLLCVFAEFLHLFACRASVRACVEGWCCAQNALCLHLQIGPAHKNFSLGIHSCLEMPEMPVAVPLHKTNLQMCTRHVRACFAFPEPRAASNRKWYAFDDCAWLISGGARVFADVHLENAPVF